MDRTETATAAITLVLLGRVAGLLLNPEHEVGVAFVGACRLLPHGQQGVETASLAGQEQPYAPILESQIFRVDMPARSNVSPLPG